MLFRSSSSPKLFSSASVTAGSYSGRMVQRCKAVLNQISQDTCTPTDVLLKPQILRNLCWTDHPHRRDVAQFLAQQGARPWQVDLLSESLSRAIM